MRSFSEIIFRDYYLGLLHYAGVALVLLTLIMASYFIKKFRFKIRCYIDDFSSFCFLGGLSFILPIMFYTKRLWGMCLHLGWVLILLSAVLLIQSFSSKKNKVIHSLLLFSLSFLLIAGLLSSYVGMQRLWHRSFSKGHVKRFAEYQKIVSFLEAYHFKSDNPLVLMDPYLYNISSNQRYRVQKMWNPSESFRHHADLIISYTKSVPDSLCESDQCYHPLQIDLDEVVIFEKQ